MGWEQKLTTYNWNDLVITFPKVWKISDWSKILHSLHLLFNFKMYDYTEWVVHSKDDRGYVTITCVVPLVFFCDENKFLQQFWTHNISLYRVFHDLRTLLQGVISYVFVIIKFHIYMWPFLDGYGVMTAWNLEEKVRIIDNKQNKIITQHNTWYI